MDKDNEKQEIFSERVRAGKRTYFFDIKATRSNDYYLTITESKRRYKDDGYTYEKHKIFLYKEDFNKFVKALNNTVNHVKDELMPEIDFSKFDEEYVPRTTNASTSTPDETKITETPESTDSAEKTEVEKSESGMDTELKWD